MREAQLARHWNILLTLEANRQGVTVDALAEQLQVNKRTIYRDLNALHESGFPITTCKNNNKTRYVFAEDYKVKLKPTFSPMELMALNLAVKSQGFLEGTVFHEALEGVQQKIRNMLERYEEYLNSIEEMFITTFRPTRDYSRAPKIIEAITTALCHKRKVKITYWTSSRQELTKRAINPYRLWFVNGTFYVVAFCHYRKEVRIFLLDRIKEVEITDERFTIPSDFDFSQYTSKAFKVLAGKEEFDVVIRVHPLLRPQLTEQKWHPSQKIEELDNGWIKVSFRLGALDEIKTWIQGYAPFMVVEKPPELVKKVVNSFKEALKVHKSLLK